MRAFCRKVKDERRGAILLESLVVFMVTIFLLFLVLAVVSLMFQRFNIQIIANETAARLGQIYGYVLVAENVTDNLDRGRIRERNPYRFRNYEDMDAAVQRIATEHATTRLRNTTFTIDVGGPPRVTATVTPDSFGRRHIEVEIEGEYIVPFREALSYFGFRNITGYRVSGYAECMDLLHYINAVDTMQYWSSLDFLDSSLVSMIDSFISLFQDFFG
jgi:competence protein ComGC